MTDESPSGAPGSRRVGRYEIVRTLGQGGMGAVYLARQLDLARQVVIKVIQGQLTREMVDRFRREALALARVSSDHAVKVYELAFHGDTPYIVMEYVDGPSLDALLRQRGKLPAAEAVRLAIETGRGLEAAHAVGVLHRDVKPANVLLTREGRAKVTDFGLAKVSTAADLTSVGTMLGTPQYMAPEQAEGLDVLDARADVYALGVTLHELLTGRLPFEGKTIPDVLAAKFDGRFVRVRELVPETPAPVDDACARLMARSKASRPASMAEAVALLEQAVASQAPRTTTRISSHLLPTLAAGPSTAALDTFDPTPERPTRAAPPSSGPAPAPDAPPEGQLPVPGRFGRFQIERLLGQGGMGAVYAAREVDLDRPCVVKVVKPELAKDRSVVERLRREANAAAKLSSDFVVRVFDFGVEGGVPFISMEYVDGPSVEAVAAGKGGLAPADATRIVLAAARGLLAAHEQGILHRDVKPANLLVARSGQVKVADFGLAKDQAEGPLTAKGAVIGTPSYMSPEQIEAETLDGRSDVYSLGVTFYELLTGQRAFEGKSVLAVLTSRARPLAPPRAVNSAVPEAAERVCLALMEPARDQRPDMVTSIAKLEALLAELDPGSPDARTSRHAQGRLAPVLVLVLVLVLGLALGAWFFFAHS